MLIQEIGLLPAKFLNHSTSRTDSLIASMRMTHKTSMNRTIFSLEDAIPKFRGTYLAFNQSPLPAKKAGSPPVCTKTIFW